MALLPLQHSHRPPGLPGNGVSTPGAVYGEADCCGQDAESVDQLWRRRPERAPAPRVIGIVGAWGVRGGGWRRGSDYMETPCRLLLIRISEDPWEPS